MFWEFRIYKLLRSYEHLKLVCGGRNLDCAELVCASLANIFAHVTHFNKVAAHSAVSVYVQRDRSLLLLGFHIIATIGSMAPRTKWQKRAWRMVEARRRVGPDNTRPANDDDREPIDEDDSRPIESDDECQMLINDSDVEAILSKLQWNEGAGFHLRKPYNGTGRSTVFARKAAMKKRQQSMQGFRPITSYFGSQKSFEPDALEPANHDEVNDPVSDCSEDELSPNLISSIDSAIGRLRFIANISKSSNQEQRQRHSKFDHVRFLCILRFLESIRENPRTRVASSRIIAKTIYGVEKGGEYKARCIRIWSDEFVKSGLLMPLRQGRHQKSESLLDDADVKQVCLQYLRARRIELIDSASFAKWVGEELHKTETLGLMRPAVISERTACRWLHRLGFHFKEYKKGTYCDGHERADVVEYRNR